MKTENFIAMHRLCEHFNVPISFLNSLYEFELIEVLVSQNERYIHKKQLKNIEKMMRLHYELDINIEGLDAVYRLLKRVEILQDEILELRNRLEFYDPNTI